MEYFTLNNGIRVPAIGLGTYTANPAGFSDVVKNALDLGYRLFDTASLYGTENEVGKALRESGLARGEYQVQSKLWIDEMGYKNVMEAFARSMERLQLDYLDIYFIHWPRQQEVFNQVPGHSDIVQAVSPYEKCDWKEKLAETYAALEELYDKGLIRGIGLSNFLPHHIMPVLEKCNVRPVADQLELHIGYTQPVAVQYAQQHNVLCEAWSPLARGLLMQDGFMKSLAEKYGVTVSQLALRYLYQLGILAIPKAASVEKMKQNLDIFSFEISEEDQYLLSCMPTAFWCKEHPDFRIPAFMSRKS